LEVSDVVFCHEFDAILESAGDKPYTTSIEELKKQAQGVENAQLTQDVETSVAASRDLLGVADKLLSDARVAYRKVIKKAAEDAAVLVARKKKDLVRLERELRKRLREGYKAGMCSGYEEGYNLGRKVGIEEKKQQMGEIIAELKSAVDRINLKQADMLKRYEEEVVDLAFSIAQKVTRTIVDKDKSVYANIAKAVLSDFRELKWVSLTVPDAEVKEMLSVGEKLLGDAVVGLKNVRISVADDADEKDSEATLLIDTPIELIDASPETQIRNIRSRLKMAL
jgi:flagellar assembly protein FliH